MSRRSTAARWGRHSCLPRRVGPATAGRAGPPSWRAGGVSLPVHFHFIRPPPVLDNAPAEGSFSPDGRLLAYTDEETGQLAVRDLVTGQKRLLTNEETQNEPARVPSVTPIWPPLSYKAWGPSFSSDGSLIAYWW